MPNAPRPVMLAILDGWGWREDRADNATRQGRTPVFTRLWSTGPHALLHTSEREGLPRVQLEAAAIGRPSFGYDIRGVRDAPGATAVGRAGDTDVLARAVAAWWRSSAVVPAADRSALDWRTAHAMVTELLEHATTAR